MEIYVTECKAETGAEPRYPVENKKTNDPRTKMACIDYPGGSNLYAYYVCVDKSIISLCVIYTQGGRESSNINAIVKYDIQKTSFKEGELYDIICQLREVLKNNNYDACDYLKCSGTAITDASPIEFSIVAKHGFAYMEYSTEEELKRIIDNLDQDEYRKYEAVFFIEKDGIVKPKGDVKNISGISLETYCTLTPAEQTKGVKVKIRIGAEEKDFDAPIRVKKGDNVTLKFSREGFDTAHPETDTFKVTEDRKYTMPNIIWSRYISKDNITVRDENLERISPREYTLFVDGTKADPNRGLPVEEKDLNRVKIRIICTGYEVWEERPCNFANNSKEEITLKRIQKEYTIKYNGIEFKGKSKANPNFPKKEVCITDKADGVYEITESTSSLTKIFIVAFISLLVGIALGWFVIANIFKETPPEQAASKETTETVATPAPEKQETKVFDCLNADRWEKSKMDAEPELKDLYEAITTTNRSEIDKYKDKIDVNKHPQWNALITAIDGTGSTTIEWCKGKDSFSVKEYIDELNKKHNSNQESAKQSQSPSSTPNSTDKSSKTSGVPSKSSSVDDDK